MHSDLVEVGWTEEHWGRIGGAVAEEAQKARVAAQVLSIVGPEDPTVVAVPSFTLQPDINPRLAPPVTAASRLTVDSNPILYLTQIAINVPLRMREAADPDLTAALGMFRRAANYIARIEDALIFNGRPGANLPPPFGAAAIPSVVQITGDNVVGGIFPFVAGAPGGAFGNRTLIRIAAVPPAPGGPPPRAGVPTGDQVVTAIIQAINQLDAQGQLGPYSCILSPLLFEAICTPTAAMVLPRDRILPFLQGGLLLRSSAIFQGPGVAPPAPFMAWGVVLAGSASPVELVVATDIQVRYLQTTEEPRLIFRVTERIAPRIKESAAIALLQW